MGLILVCQPFTDFLSASYGYSWEGGGGGDEVGSEGLPSSGGAGEGDHRGYGW